MRARAPPHFTVAVVILPAGLLGKLHATTKSFEKLNHGVAASYTTIYIYNVIFEVACKVQLAFFMKLLQHLQRLFPVFSCFNIFNIFSGSSAYRWWKSATELANI